jgi:hypothetical protein
VYQVFLGTACHDPRFMSSRMLKCTGWYLGARVLNVAWMHLRKVAQYRLGGHGMSGHSKSDPACQPPVSILSGIVDPSGSVRSAIDITLRYSWTVFACLSCPEVILGIALKRSIIYSSLCLWSGGVHACSIQIVPSISNSLCLISTR